MGRRGQRGGSVRPRLRRPRVAVARGGCAGLLRVVRGNARSGPGAEYSQVAYVNYGEVYDVYETRRASNGVTWFKIIVNGRYCWISSGLTNTGKY